jgi:hypothetical protein
MAKYENGVSPKFCQKSMISFITKIYNDVPSYRVGEESRANPKGLTLLPNIYPSERYQLCCGIGYVVRIPFPPHDPKRFYKSLSFF